MALESIRAAFGRFPCPSERTARIARYRARRRNGRSVFKVEANKADIILALRGLAYSAGMDEFMLAPDASREEIERKLSLLLSQIIARWREHLCFKSKG
jgi:hypothetical protein